MSAISRSAVYWFGLPPTHEEQREFARRGLAIRTLADSTVIDFNLARAVIYCARPPGVPAACERLRMLRSALDHGLMVYLLAADDAIQAHLQRELPDAARSRGRIMENVRARTGDVPAFESAENIARHLAGRHASTTLDIRLPPGKALPAEHEFFVRRAFNDCTRVMLDPLPGGRSASAFSAHATLMASEVGPRPLPFFVKLDEAEKILTEAKNYELYASHHIPWYLRPNLDPSRCLHGVECGILVGSFVEYSESLWEAVLKGTGPRYIHALFEDTLMGWRSQAYNRAPSKGLLASSLNGVFKWDKVPQKTTERAAEHGSVCSPKDLWEQLINLPEQRWRTAPIHGDMHAENVRVRNNDAIIIDLADVRPAPLCADVANLEVWLTFQVPSSQDQTPDRAIWTQVVRELYTPPDISRPPSLATTEVGVDWLRACVRQTRMIANAVCECDTEYPTAIALHLLRRAQYADEGNDEDAYRRGLAYFLGSNVVRWLAMQASTATGTP